MSALPVGVDRINELRRDRDVDGVESPVDLVVVAS